MKPDSPTEGPEHRTETLSPVSPKPLHYSQPSNIPLLGSQMDPSFTGSTEQVENSTSHDQMKIPQQVDSSTTVPTNGGSQEQTDAQVKSPRENHTASGYSTSTGPPNSIIPGIGTTPYNDSPMQSLDDLIDNAQAQQSEMMSKVQTNDPSVDTSTDPAQRQASDDAQPADVAMTMNAQSQGQAPSMADASSGNVVDDSSGGDINFQALLDRLAASTSTSTAPSADALTAATTQATELSPNEDPSKLIASAPSIPNETPTPSLPSGVNLPPRPPKQEPANLQPAQQSANGTFPQSEQSQSAQQRYVQPPGASFQIPPQAPPPLLTAGAPGTSFAPVNGLPPPPVATFQQSQGSPTIPGVKQEPKDRPTTGDSTAKEEEDMPWAPEVQKEYDTFLVEERKYVMEGQWDRFPANSRLFIGNLPTEKVTKRDLYHVFHTYGKLAQVSIKQAYGFIQFLETEACQRALRQEQGVEIRGRRLHLEISKPQGRNKNNDGGRNSRNRRSRSPEKGIDRYRSGGAQPNNRNRGDGWRPNRSPDRGMRRRSPDYYDGRRRSRTPPGRSNYRGSAQGFDDDDGLALPRRRPNEVPDVQILAKDEPDRAFLEYVENTYRNRGVSCSVLRLSSRLSEAAVMRRQILEGVLAVSRINRNTMAGQKFQLSLFDRSAGAANVKFEEYEQELHICVELVHRAKSTHRPPQNDYNSSPYGLPIVSNNQQQAPRPPMPPFQQSFQQHAQQPMRNMPTPQQNQYSPNAPSFPPPPNMSLPPPPLPGQNPQMDMTSAINSLSSNDLQRLLGSLQSNTNQSQSQQSPTTPSFGGQAQQIQQMPPQQQSQTAVNDLARIFNTGMPPQQQNQEMRNLAQNPAFASAFGVGPQAGGSGGGGMQGQGGGGGTDMGTLLDQLSRYGGQR